MSTPRLATRLTILAIPLTVALCCGCSSTGGVSFPLGPFARNADPVSDHDAWWKANANRKVFVPGKGYAIEGTPGYFDENGRLFAEGAEQAALVASQSSVESSSGFSLKKFHPTVALEGLKSAVGQGPNEQRARAIFEEGETLFRKQAFASAAGKFAGALKRSTDPALRQQAIFMQGESHFFADEYPEANDAYSLLVKEYPASRDFDKVIARQFDLARYWQQYHEAQPHWPITPNLFDKTRHTFDTLGHALKVFENIRLNDPTGPFSDDALMSAANAHFKQGNYEQADYHYGLLRREYPKSEHQFEAHLLGLQAKLRRYQGPDYSGSGLEEAEKLVKQLLTQFPTEVQAERERIERIRAELVAQQALRDWTMAEYYAGGKHYGSARYYYELVAGKYPDTQLARQSRDRLAEYQSEPATPPVKLAWLVDAYSSDSSAEKKTAVATAPQGSGTRR